MTSIRAALVVAVVLGGCGLPQPGPNPEPEQNLPNPTESSSSELTLALSRELVASGGDVFVMRMRSDKELVVERRQIDPGTTALKVASASNELLGLVERSSNLVVRSQVQQPGCAPSPALTGVVHHVPGAFATIQAAIDAASPGDEVRVGPGVFTEQLVLRSGIALRGSGADQTTLDAQGAAVRLIDFTNAANVSISGFTFRGVGLADTCGHDVFACSGNWYAAAIFADGHEFQLTPSTTGGEPTTCPGSSAFISHNIFEGNAIAVMPYFHAIAVVQNNLFVGNAHAYVANHLQDRGAVLNNTLVNSVQNAIAVQAGYVDVLNNVVVDSYGRAMFQQHIQRGRVRTNLVFGRDMNNELSFTIGTDGNVEADPLFVDAANGDYRLGAGSPGIDVGTDFDADGTPADLGAWGGPSGVW